MQISKNGLNSKKMTLKWIFMYVIANIGVDTAENEPSKVLRAPLNVGHKFHSKVSANLYMYVFGG